MHEGKMSYVTGKCMGCDGDNVMHLPSLRIGVKKDLTTSDKFNVGVVMESNSKEIVKYPAEDVANLEGILLARDILKTIIENVQSSLISISKEECL